MHPGGHSKHPDGDRPQCADPQSFTIGGCSQRLVVPSLAHESTVQGLRSSQSMGALLTQRNVDVSQLHVPRQAS